LSVASGRDDWRTPVASCTRTEPEDQVALIYGVAAEELDRLAAAMRNTQKFLLDFVEANRDRDHAGTHICNEPARFVCSLVSGLFRNLARDRERLAECGGVRT